jgi:hypothetical protein
VIAAFGTPNQVTLQISISAFTPPFYFRRERRGDSWYPSRMTLKARVRNGRLVVDEPTELPEGTEIALLPLDPGDWLDTADRAALHRALLTSQDDIEAGRLVDAEEVLRELRGS